MRINYAQAVFGYDERMRVFESLLHSWLASGKMVEEFENKIAALYGKKYALATNSGSSANLLALASLNLPRGSEIITPALTFATTVAPIVQLGLKPIFVDCTIGTYKIDTKAIESKITPFTIGLFIPQLIGYSIDMKKIEKLARKHNLFIIEDSCDTVSLPSCADLVTTSFYGSHIITSMGTGGMVMTDSKILIDELRLLTNWGRVGTHEKDFNKRFNFEIDGIPYDSEFVYEVPGYNLRMSEAQAAFGLVQLEKLKEFLRIRNGNFKHLTRYFTKYKKWFYLPDYTNPLAYALTIKDKAPFTRKEFLKHLNSRDVQVRVLFSGNITRHPAYRKYLEPFKNADLVMKSGFLMGLHHGMNREDVNALISICEEFLSKYD